VSANTVDGWRARLTASRTSLLRALEGVTEREFAAAFDGERSLVRVLAELAANERAAVAQARGDERSIRVPEKPLAPQVIHDLAGARYQTARLIEEAGPAASPEAAEHLAALVELVAAREESVATRIAERPRE
jgi:hypothetical protein